MTKAKHTKETESKRRGGLEEPYPSSPYRTPRYVFYISRPRDEFFEAQAFYAMYAAKKFYDALTKDVKVESVDVNRVAIKELGLEIMCEQIMLVKEHKLTALEEDWELDHPHINAIKRYRGEAPIRWEPYDAQGDPISKEPKRRTVKAGRKERKPREKKERTSSPRQRKEGFTSVGDIAKDLGCQPREARAALRKSKENKPEGGWQWGDPKEIERIKGVIKKYLKG